MGSLFSKRRRVSINGYNTSASNDYTATGESNAQQLPISSAAMPGNNNNNNNNYYYYLILKIIFYTLGSKDPEG